MRLVDYLQLLEKVGESIDVNWKSPLDLVFVVVIVKSICSRHSQLRVAMEYQVWRVICLKSISDSFDWLGISPDNLDQVVIPVPHGWLDHSEQEAYRHHRSAPMD